MYDERPYDQYSAEELYKDLRYLYNNRYEHTQEFKEKYYLYKTKFPNDKHQRELEAYIHGESEAHDSGHQENNCSVQIVQIPGNRMLIVSLLVQLTHKSYQECRVMTDSLPCTVASSLTEGQAESIGKQFAAYGAKVMVYSPSKGTYPISNDNGAARPSSGTKQGCYIATCVYHSYDCPEVWALRRYRDYYLDEHFLGKLFIRVYYAVSPTLVRWFGKNTFFRNTAKHFLDKKLIKLERKGYGFTPYHDKY